MLPGHVIGKTGAGDVKLFAALGTLLGPTHIVVAFLYTAIAGGLLAIVVAVGRRRLRETVVRTAALVSTGGNNVAQIEHPSADNRFAYAPAIAVGNAVAGGSCSRGPGSALSSVPASPKASANAARLTCSASSERARSARARANSASARDASAPGRNWLSTSV